MKTSLIAILLLAVSLPVSASDRILEKYIRDFDYVSRIDMKINSKELIKLLKEGKAQLIDIRFKEEYAAWKVGPALSIPLNELPQRLNEIDKSKVVVTACPHKDRATIAMVYLRSKGIEAKYLTDGLIGMAENLRGDNAWDFMQAIKQ
jgi:rhodanese-related sulfurtransferase